jgi:hypothetical protein
MPVRPGPRRIRLRGAGVVAQPRQRLRLLTGMPEGQPARPFRVRYLIDRGDERLAHRTEAMHHKLGREEPSGLDAADVQRTSRGAGG